MLLKITHSTELAYSDLICESVIELRMAPRQEMDQHRLSFQLEIGPRTEVGAYFDWLDNTVHTFTVPRYHNRIRIVATSVVETDRPLRDAAMHPARWPVSVDMLDHSVHDYLTLETPSAGGQSPVIDDPRLRALVAEIRPQHGEPLGAVAGRMLGLIDDGFIYEKGITTAASPITEVLEHRKGVCQDFTHLMIALARSMGIPARYVSGLVHPLTTGRHRGATQTHAWCELQFAADGTGAGGGSGGGWVGFDPTNRCTIGANYVKVAVGRDFRDVPPNKGVYRGKAREAIDVIVRSEELPFIPPELVSERYAALTEVPSYPDATAHEHSTKAHQMAQQQQQGFASRAG